jgi:outer membrane protein OmpA-like peptidoglycan-associated protein
VEDMKDNCPTEKGTITNAGCPEIKAEDKKILADALYGVQFEVGSAVIKESSFYILGQVAAVMSKYPAYRLTIAGHTDNQGKESENQTLSTNRARACYDYLSRQGIVSNRMTYVGYGSSNPVMDNGTAIGRSQNRRVEFNLKAN